MEKVDICMIDVPEGSRILGGILYIILGFISVTLFLPLLMLGLYDNAQAMAWCQIFFHTVNFAVALATYGRYLRESFWTVQLDTKKYILTVAACAALMIVVMVMVIIGGAQSGSPQIAGLTSGLLPMSEMELFMLSWDLVYINPVAGTACLVILAPVSISCLYYATAFAPVCCKRPWLAYFAVSLVIAIPRIVSGLTFWDPMEEMIIYLMQLPLYLTACWAYQRTNTIWAPIAVHGVVNLLSCFAVIAYAATGV